MKYSPAPNHIEFILMPADNIIKEIVAATEALGSGIETYPICEYLLPSTFLKVAGAQEQKLKCICWEMACRDYAYRYERYEKNPYSECSSYKDKCTVYNDLRERISELDSTFQIDDAYKTDILNEWRCAYSALFENTEIAKSFSEKYQDCKEILPHIGPKWMMVKKDLFLKKDSVSAGERSFTNDKSLFDLFGQAYDERNRCAHNTRSYQHNIPSIRTLATADFSTDNYFLYIALLLLLDRIYIKLFKGYLTRI